MAKKIIYVTSTHNCRKTVWSATIDEMCNEIFGYSLECGHSWNNKIPRYPKTAKSLVNALNKSADECRRYYDYYDLSTEKEIEYFKSHVNEGNNHVNLRNDF